MTASRIGRYEILRPLGRGAMGIVYLALDPQIDRTIALKTIRFGEAGGGFDKDEAKARFLKEARISGRLLHRNIVTVFDVGEDEGTLYLAMEYVSGGSLAQKLVGPEALLLTDRVRIVAEVADALAHAHERGVIHRDIKPANILLTESLTAKVTDFGIGKLLAGDTELTSTGQMIGSPAYMSPEQIRGEKVDVRTDIFSLGVVLYQTLTSRKPFPADTLTTLVYQILHEEPSDPLALQSDLPPDVSEVVKGCLAKKREDRYSDASVLADDLRRLIGISPVTSTASLSASRLKRGQAAAPMPETVQLTAIESAAPPQSAPETAPPTEPVPAFPPPTRRSAPGLSMQLAALGASVLILGAVGYFAVRELRQPTVSPQATPIASTGTPAVPLPTFADPSRSVATPAVPPASPGAVPSPGPAPTGRLKELAPTAPPHPTRSPHPAAVPSPAAPRPTAVPSRVAPSKPTSRAPSLPPPDFSLMVRKRIKINVSPSQARVFMDGRYIGISDDWDNAGGGSQITFASEGKHRFRFTYPGRRDLLVDVTATSEATEDQVELDMSMEKGEPKAPSGPEGKLSSPDYKTMGPVRFQVTPPEATVTLNGKLLGPSSIWRNEDLILPEIGVYEIVLSAPGYRAKQIRVISAPATGKSSAVVKESLKKE